MRSKLENVQLGRYGRRLQPNVEFRRVARIHRLVSGSRVDKARARVPAHVFQRIHCVNGGLCRMVPDQRL